MATGRVNSYTKATGLPGLLFVEPRQAPTAPLLDELTYKIAAAFARRVEAPGGRYRGFHVCSCGARSDNANWTISGGFGGFVTNSLAVHYVACHRDEIPADELADVAALPAPAVRPDRIEW